MKGAKVAFDKYLEMAPGQANPHDSMGDYLKASGDLKGALSHYQQSYALDPAMTVSQEKAKEIEAMMQKE